MVNKPFEIDIPGFGPSNPIPSSSRRGFNIDDFRATIQRRGVARNNMYKILLSPPLPVVQNSGVDKTLLEDLQFMATNVTLPGIQFATAEVRNQTIGPVEYKPYVPMFSRDITINFIVDQQGAILDFFHTWMRSIINYSSEGKGFGDTTYSSSFPYEVSYKGEYTCDIRMHVMDSQASKTSKNFNTKEQSADVEDFIYEYVLYKAYPVGIMDTQVSYGTTDQFLSIPVVFNYFDWSGTSIAAKNGEHARSKTPADGQGPSPFQLKSFLSNIINRQDVTGTVTDYARGQVAGQVTSRLKGLLPF